MQFRFLMIDDAHFLRPFHSFSGEDFIIDWRSDGRRQVPNYRPECSGWAPLFSQYLPASKQFSRVNRLLTAGMATMSDSLLSTNKRSGMLAQICPV
jgi:hypothetical protein